MKRMGAMDRAESRKNPVFWDIFVLSPEGRWVGLRAPWEALRKVATVMGALLLVTALALSGWLMTRWQIGRLDRRLAFERLKVASLESQLKQPAAVAPTATTVDETHSFLPGLGADEVATGGLHVENAKFSYDSVSGEVHAAFDLVRTAPAEGPSKYQWILLLHGTSGVLSFPPALASRGGELIQFQKGQMVEDVRSRRTVRAQYKIVGFEALGVDPVFASLVVYDAKGSVVARGRYELGFLRAAAGRPRGGA